MLRDDDRSMAQTPEQHTNSGYDQTSLDGGQAAKQKGEFGVCPDVSRWIANPRSRCHGHKIPKQWQRAQRMRRPLCDVLSDRRESGNA